MPIEIDWIKTFMYLGTLGAGGLAGAILNNYLIDKRNRVQKITKNITVSYVDVPSIMPGFDASISLSKAGDNDEIESYSFKRIAIVKIDLRNTSNRDFESFSFGIDFPEETQGIGLQIETPDRYHAILTNEEIRIENPRSQFDFKLEPFNRKDNYSITIVASTNDGNIYDKITLSKSHSVIFVESISVEISTYNRIFANAFRELYPFLAR